MTISSRGPMFNRCCIIVLICGALGSSACQVTWDVLDGYVLECDANTPCPTGGVCTDDGFCQIDDDPICGNGVIETGEICDEGEANEDGYHHAKTCLSDCSNYGGYCGDGIENGGEQCDDGGDNSDINPDACRVNCTSPRCGDAVVDTSLGEICDDGLDGNTDAYGEPGRCGTDCIAPKAHSAPGAVQSHARR